MNKAVGGVAREIGDLEGIVGGCIGVGEQEALSGLERVTWVEREQECAVAGIGRIKPGHVRACSLAEGGPAGLSINKEFEISGSKSACEIAAVDGLVEFQFEGSAVREKLKACAGHELWGDVVNGTATSNRVGDNLGEFANAIAGIILQRSGPYRCVVRDKERLPLLECLAVFEIDIDGTSGCTNTSK